VCQPTSMPQTHRNRGQARSCTGVRRPRYQGKTPVLRRPTYQGKTPVFRRMPYQSHTQNL
jgi:hypothetical protein